MKRYSLTLLGAGARRRGLARLAAQHTHRARLLADRSIMLPSVTVLCFMAVATRTALAAPARCYDWLLREKMRGGYLSASDPRATAAQMKAIGMNTLLPKFGDLQSPPSEANVRLLREWGEAAQNAGMHLLPVFNFRGGETEKILSPRREVTISGQRMERTPCPLDEQFWQTYILGRAVALATLAKELHLDGAIIDPEMYGADHTVFDHVCYCDDCLQEFLQSAGEQIPHPLPQPAARADWLMEGKLTERYQQQFIARVRGFSQRAEREVHKQNADFLLGVFLLDYPLPFMRGMAQGLGTDQHPVLGFSETTYGAGYTKYVEEQQKTFASFPSHVLFVPGLWIAQFPTENLAEQCYACAKESAGYWIYTFESLVEDVSNLPGYALREPNDRYWAAMKVANTELDKLIASGGKYESALKVRPYDPPLPVLVVGKVTPESLIPVKGEKPFSLGPEVLPRLRYRNPLFLLCKAGEPVEVKVANQQLNVNYRYGTQYAVIGPDGKRVQEGVMKVGENATAKWTPDRDGVYVVLADSSQNGYLLQMMSKQPAVLKATQEQRLTVNGLLGRLYFYVPAGVTRFSLFVKAEGQASGRGGKLAVYSPDGQVAARLSGDLGTLTELPVPVPEQMQKRVWALTAEDVTNDLSVYFSPNMPPYFSTDPARLLVDSKFTD